MFKALMGNDLVYNRKVLPEKLQNRQNGILNFLGRAAQDQNDNQKSARQIPYLQDDNPKSTRELQYLHDDTSDDISSQ